MKLVLKHGSRPLAMVLALVLLVSGLVQALSTSALAAGTSYNLYTFIATNCYSNQPVATNILTSGALVDAGSVTISYPGSDLLSVAGGKLNAKRHALYGSDGRVHSVWEPVTYTISDVEKSFNGATSVTLTQQGSFHVDVTYRLNTSISSDMLNLPAILASEAASQMTVLNRLVYPDEPYMGYMKQLTKQKVNLLHSVLDPNSALAAMIVLIPEDSNKNVAVKESFREVIQKMLDNCFTDEENATLKLYKLLLEYADMDENADNASGLHHYYLNSEQYNSEINLFSQYMDELLGAETRTSNGKQVYLSEDDKQNAINNLLKIAANTGLLSSSTTLDFTDLRNKTNTAKEMLGKPSEYIDVKSANLKTLTDILETKATVTDGYRATSVVKECTGLILTQTVSADLNNTGDDNTGGDNTGDNTGDNADGDNTGDDDSENNTGGSYSDYDSTSYVSTATNLKKALTSADNGDTIRVLSAITMTEDISVNNSIKITGAKYLNDVGHVLTLTDTKASIAADDPLNVASGVDGYVPVKAKNANTYTLAEVNHPETGGKTAGSKTEKLNNTRYLYLDLDPVNGMTLDALYSSTSFGELADYTVKFSIEGNTGNGLVKTADRLVVKAFNADDKCVAQISYVVIVMGDTNCNGKVNTSDATVTKNISMGKESTLEARMAADVNFSGTLEAPKVNSSDVSFTMAKWFAWDLNKYVSNLK